ncbi:hypothetical protein MMC12_006505 [Toensbergia leucococca]|nr:hypothetical protein [Toensbergia leucococca]
MKGVHSGKPQGQGQISSFARKKRHSRVGSAFLSSTTQESTIPAQDILSSAVFVEPEYVHNYSGGDIMKGSEYPLQRQRGNGKAVGTSEAISTLPDHPTNTQTFELGVGSMDFDGSVHEHFDINDNVGGLEGYHRYQDGTVHPMLGDIDGRLPLSSETLPELSFKGLQDIDAEIPAFNEDIEAPGPDDFDDKMKHSMISFIESKYLELSRINEEIRKLEELKSKRIEVKKDIAGLEGNLQKILPHI